MPQGIDFGTVPQPVLQINLFQKYADFLHTGAIELSTATKHPTVQFQIIWQQDDSHFGTSTGQLALAAQLPSVSALVGVANALAHPTQQASWRLWKNAPLPSSFGGEYKLAPDGTVELSLNVNTSFTIHSQTLGDRTQGYVFHKVGNRPETAPGNTDATITTLFTGSETEGAASAVILSLTAFYWAEPRIK